MAKVRKDNKGRNLRPGETQRADGSYMYVYKLGTKKKYLYDSDLASLRVKEKQINKDKDDGIRTQEAMKLTLNDMFKVYMNNNIKLKPSTRANYLYLWDFYVKEEPFANMPLPQIHRSDILAFYTKLLKHGFAINSLESINTIVHPTLEMAVDDDYIRKNPSKGIYRKLKTDGSAPKPKRRIALTKTQQQNFLRFIAKSPTYSHWLPIMTVLLGTGMRVAECTGITKSDINLSENTISVNHNLIYRVIDGKAGFHITTPKTESGTRIIPILYPEVAEQLRLQIETIDALYPDDQLVLGGVHGFVFRNRTGPFMSAHNINRAIERISVTYNMKEMDQAELEDREPDLLPHFSVHNLRHTFCTRLCLCNLKFYEKRWLYCKYIALVRTDLNHLVLLNKLQCITDTVLCQVNLVISLYIHEMIEIIIGIQILHVLTINVSSRTLLCRTECLFYYTTTDDIF
jgi:integrase